MEFILDEMEIVADPFALCELRGQCDLGLSKDPSATLHYILTGQGEILVPGKKPVAVSQGSLVLIPALRQHTLRSFGNRGDPIPACRPAELELVHLIHGDESDNTNGQLTSLCAHVTLGLRNMQNLIDLVRMPITETVSNAPPLAQPITVILDELSAPRIGSRAMIRTQLLVCMIELLRRRMVANEDDVAWMAALRDPKLWPVLRHMLDAPGDAHSVDSLADMSGMSRSLFAKRFSEAYGSGPMELLRELRIRLASSLLEESDLPVKRIAEIVGFRSRTAFSRTFEKIVGLSPQNFRSRN